MPERITSAMTKDLMITVYQDGFGLVREVRTIPRVTGSIIQYTDIPEQIEPDSLLVKGLNIIESNYEYRTDKHKLLEKYAGSVLRVVQGEEEHTYKLLSASGALIVKDLQTGEIVLDPKGDIRFEHLPEDVHLEPAFVWHIQGQAYGTVEVSYLTNGMSWDAGYVMELTGHRFRLVSWITLKNFSGMTYKDALLKVIAGTVNRARFLRNREVMVQQSSQPIPEHQIFSDYHLYTIQRRVTIHDQQQKSLKLLEAPNAAYETIYEVRKKRRHPAIYFEFNNTKENMLGIPLPKGNVKLYREDKQTGTFEFIGEDRIGQTAVNEQVRLFAGVAFDITVYSGDVDRYTKGNFEYEVMIYEIRNQKEEAANILIKHEPDGPIWSIEESIHPWERKEGLIHIKVIVPAKTTVDIKFTIKYEMIREQK